MDTGQCIGNLVHNSRILQIDQSQKHAQFGITEDGQYISGYVDSSRLLSSSKSKITELIAGKGWLIRNFKNVIDSSIEIEKIEQDFIDIIAPRTGIGYDKDGR